MNPSTPNDIYTALVERMGLSGPYASLLSNRKRKPSLDLAVKIKDELGIDPAVWVNGGDIYLKNKRKKRAAEAA